MKAMQVGTLVSLSAYGKKMNRHHWVWRNDVGIIVKRGEYYTGQYNYKIKWAKSSIQFTDSRWGFSRRDLKCAK